MQIKQHSGNDLLTYVECDATGRFVYATRYVNISTSAAPAVKSDNYGDSFEEMGLNGVEDFWVSATGQFVCAVTNPGNGGASYFYYSDSYGRDFFGLSNPASVGQNNTYKTIGGSADGSILVLGSGPTEAGFAGDGKIRIARQAQQNISELSVIGGTIEKVGGAYTITYDSGLHYAGLFTADNNTNTYNLSWANIVNPQIERVKEMLVQFYTRI